VTAVRSTVDPAALRYGAEDGLVPVVVQEVASGAVLMVAWADREAVERTLASGEGWFWSRSRKEPWRKGATSGNTLAVVEVRGDCDGDTLLYRVDAAGPACHRGTRTCFDGENVNRSARGEAAGAEATLEAVAEAAAGGQPADAAKSAADAAAEPASPTAWGPRLELGWLWDVLEARRGAEDPESYTARLLAAGVDRAGRKLGEEATETVIAALRAAEGGAESRRALAGEAADLLYHLLVLLMAGGATPEEVAAELRRRHRAPRRPAAAKPEDPPLAESVDVPDGRGKDDAS
jgi:phosphoribosyl-ATP pyrophosphohydrolase/phosphoribosyl-AMP cyclohydrolase